MTAQLSASGALKARRWTTKSASCASTSATFGVLWSSNQKTRFSLVLVGIGLSSFSTLVQRLHRQFASGLREQYGDFLDTSDLSTREGRLGTAPFDER